MDSVGIGELPDAAALRRRGQQHARQHRARGAAARADAAVARPRRASPTSAATRRRRRARSDGWPRRRRARTRSPVTGKWPASSSTSHFRRFPHGFPAGPHREFERRIGRPTLGNTRRVRHGDHRRSSAPEHMRTGAPIVYTSADSVFQIAAHEDVIPLDELYRICDIAFDLVARGLGVGRVIARPFVGDAGPLPAHRQPPRLRARRRSAPTLLDRLTAAGMAGRRHRQDRGSVRRPRAHEGRPHDVGRARHGRRRGASCDATPRGLDLRQPRRLRHASTAIATTSPGYAANLERFDARLARAAAAARGRRDLLVVTADHGNDPTTPSTDHSREHVPLLRRRARRCAPASISARARRSPISARRSPTCSACRRSRTARAFSPRSCDRLAGPSPPTVMSSIREQLEAPRARVPGAARPRRAPRAAAASGPSRDDPIRPGLPARSRSRHPLEGVPPAEAQDAGLLRADRRSLPHAADAHARGLADRAQHRQGAAAARGADRGDRARPRSRPSAVRPRRRARDRSSSCPAASATTSRACASSTCSRTAGRA